MNGTPSHPTHSLPLHEATALLEALAGRRLTADHAVLSFGDQSQLGDVTIQDVAGNNVIKHNLFVVVSLPSSVAGRPEARPKVGVAPVSAVAPIDRVGLRRVIDVAFNLDELKSICFELGIDHEELAGSTKSAKIQELIGFCERRGRFSDLVRQVRTLRPHMEAQIVARCSS